MIAALLTCYNRKDKTLACLKKLFEIADYVDVYLVDDGSTDGTIETISKYFPQVKIINGTGNLFWCRGMNLAWQFASKRQYNFYLWLNDDVLLYDFAIQELMACSNLNNDNAIICGLVESTDNSKVIYGGFTKNKLLVSANGLMNDIIQMNGNIVLVPKSVFIHLGNLDPKYHHDLGDVDYGLRALEKGIKVLSTTRIIAAGTKNTICRIRLNNTTLSKRFKQLYSPLGSPPKIDFYFRKCHRSFLNATANFIFLHLINVIPDFLNEKFFGNKYK